MDSFRDLSPKSTLGFTLIELSIVMVIIGLIIGGVLVGNDLIDAAKIRSQVTQLEKYNVAVATFRVKYGYLPGDMPDPHATNFGFIARGQFAGQGDGNGILEGNVNNSYNGNYGHVQASGETLVFWIDLSMAGLIPDNLQSSFASQTTAAGTLLNEKTTPKISDLFPKTKISEIGHILVYSSNGENYYQIADTYLLNSTNGQAAWSREFLSVNHAYNVDKKIDDGKPQSGNVSAQFMSGATWTWAGTGGITGGAYTTPNSYSSTTCFDNGGIASEQKYSLNTETSNNKNCSLRIGLK